MSINKGIIKKYTRALFKVVVKENDINQVSDRLHNIRSILKSVPELNQLLITRRVQVQDKINMLKNILGDNISNIESFRENLLKQINFLKLEKDESLIANQIIGTLENDGYLRRDIESIIDDINP